MIRLDNRDADFAKQFVALVNARREADSDVSRDVAAIVVDVKARGDAAVADYTARFDGHTLDWRISREACQTALDTLDPDLRTALELAAARIRTYHEKQRRSEERRVGKECCR